METNAEKMHLMISSAAYQTSIVKAYESSVEKYNLPAVKTMQDAINNSSPSLISIKNKLKKDDRSPAMISDILKLMVAKTVRAFNISRNIEPQQIVDLVETIEQEFYYLKLSEVYLILRDAKLGKYGKLYERIDEPTIIGWFQDYVDKRVEHFVKNNELNHDKATANERSRYYDNFVMNMQVNHQQEQENKIKNIAYAMAKKMTANNQQQSAPVNESNNPGANSDKTTE